MKAARVLPVLVFLLGVGATAHADWHGGIGTGFFRMNSKGTEGFDTAILGPIAYDIDLDPDDFSDVTESAFGFGGYASNGTWVLRYALGTLDMAGEGSETVSTPEPATASQKLAYDITFGEFIAGYNVYSKGRFTLMAEAGLRYNRHDITVNTKITTTKGTTSTGGNLDKNWTDFVAGISTRVVFAEKWSWDTILNGGFGGSEGSYLAQMGVGWKFAKRWSASFYAKYAAIEYEDGNPGDSGWYLYDVDEFGTGLSFLFHF